MSQLNKIKIEKTRRGIKRELARRSVFNFLKYTFRHYKYENWHHKVVSDFYQTLIERKITRGIVMLPPRHSKTEGCERAMSWAYGKNHYNENGVLIRRGCDERIINCSAAMPRARKTSVNVKRNVKDRLFSEVYPNFLNDGISRTRTVKNNKDIKEDQNTFWELGSGARGSFLAAGARGTITGEGFTIGNIDDPTGSAEDADSPTMQDREEEWFTGTFLDRQDEEDSVIMLTMQRWSVNDMIARRLKNEGMASYNGYKPQEGVPEWNGQPDGEWHVLCLPRIMDEEAILWKHPDDPREIGEVLWPQRYSIEMALKFKKNLPKHIWESKHQQRPKARGGNLIDGRWFPVVEPSEVPSGGKFVRFWDLAATMKIKKAGKTNDPDFTAGTLVQYHPESGKYYIWDVDASQESPYKRDRMVLRNAKNDRVNHGDFVLNTWEDVGLAGKEVNAKYLPLLKRFLRQPTPVSKNKDFFIRLLANKAETGDVIFVNGHWLSKKFGGHTVIELLEAYPGKLFHDDIPDSMGKACYVASGGGIEELESPERIQRPVVNKTIMQQIEKAVLSGLIPPRVENLEVLLEAIADKYVDEGDAEKADLFLDAIDKVQP